MRRIHPDIRRRHLQRGFTLVEMVVVMTITAILVSVVAVFIRGPMLGIMDSVRRAGMADAADTALRRMKRDIQRALPNSVRVSQNGSTWYIEFIPVLAAGRYCAEADCGSAALDFSGAVSSFSFVGPQPSLATIPSGTEVVIYNLGTSGANAYEGSNSASLSAIGSSTITLAAATAFPYPSPGKRFFIVGTPVSYACAAGGSLRRISSYGKLATQPVTTPSGSTSVLLADNIGTCSVDYQQNAIDQYGLIYLSLQITKNNESVSLTHAVQINNIP